MFEEIVDSKTLEPIITYFVVPLSKAPISTPHKVLNKKRKTRWRTHLANINQAQSYTKASARFLLNAFHKVSHAIICAHTDKIALYNNTDTACCADSGAPE